MKDVFKNIPTIENQYKIGDFLNIDETEKYKIKEIKNSSDIAKNFGIETKINVPVLFLDGVCGKRQAAYDTNKKIILIFKSTTTKSIHHEIIHSIEYHQEKSPELIHLWELAKQKISEDSFDNGFFNFNFVKSINEFIADGYSSDDFINALKKENLYESFLEESKCLFQ